MLHNLKKCNPAFKAQIQSLPSRDHRDITTLGKKTLWARLYQTALTGRCYEGKSPVTGESKSMLFIHFTRRVENSMSVAGIPLPRHGFRHISCPPPCFPFPHRMDFQIVQKPAAASYSAGSFQISVQQELAEIRRIEVSPRQRKFLPLTFAASRKGHRPAWAKPVPLSPLITLAAARFQLLISVVEGVLNLSIEEVVAKAKDYESRESMGVRALVPAVYHSLRHLFQINHCIGNS